MLLHSISSTVLPEKKKRHLFIIVIVVSLSLGKVYLLGKVLSSCLGGGAVKESLKKINLSSRYT